MALPSSGQISFDDVRIETSQSQFPGQTISGLANDYNFGYSDIGWTTGGNEYVFDGDTMYLFNYAPINILSSGTRWSDTSGDFPNSLTSITYPGDNPPSRGNYSMSAWYRYNHTLYNPTNVTGALWNHTQFFNNSTGVNAKTMLPVYIGNTDRTLRINYSGSVWSSSLDTILPVEVYLEVWYGKPWINSGSLEPSQSVTSFYLWGSNIKDDPLSRRLITRSLGGSYFSYPSQSFNVSFDWEYKYTASVGQYLYFVLGSNPGVY